jgi:hypothetical protein
MHELFEAYKKSATGLRLGMALLAPSTQKQCIDIIDRFLDPGFGQMRLGALTAGMVTKYLSFRCEGLIVAPNKSQEGRRGGREPRAGGALGGADLRRRV